MRVQPKLPMVGATLAGIMCVHFGAWAFFMPQSIPLQTAVSAADAVVVARIRAFSPDPAFKRPSAPVLLGMDGAIAVSLVQPPGLYTFEVIRPIKPGPSPVLTLKLPYLLSTYYRGANLKIGEGDLVLLLLKSTAQGWHPLDPTVPLIPLERSLATEVRQGTANSAISQVVGLMLESLSNAVFRRANLYILRFQQDPRIAEKVHPFVHDPDLTTRDMALFCLIVNQQIQFIPDVVRLERQLMPDEETVGSSAASLQALDELKTATAIPFLNPMLFEPSKYSRVNSILALVRLADRSSVPYLVLALRDPDRSVAALAYGLLHRLIRTVGPAKDRSYFHVQRGAETRILYAWWRDELAGKHPPQGGEGAPFQDVKADLVDVPVDKLNPMLFQVATPTRLAAIAALDRRADASSLPFLILALSDPNEDVAYHAYSIIHRLLPGLGRRLSREALTARGGVALKPIYDWWEYEWMGRHAEVG